jgi:hypothetical protein
VQFVGVGATTIIIDGATGIAARSTVNVATGESADPSVGRRRRADYGNASSPNLQSPSADLYQLSAEVRPRTLRSHRPGK